MRGSGWLGAAALLLAAMPAAAQDCAGQVIILGAGSQAEGAGYAYWATLSNPGMRAVQVEPRWGEARLPVLRIEPGRMQRVRLGMGAARLAAEAIEAGTGLRCQPITRLP